MSFELDRRSLVRAFHRAAPDYDAAARLQRQTRLELLGRLEYFRLEPGCILDLGAGPGQAAIALQRAHPGAQVLALDIAFGMLQCLPPRRWPWSAAVPERLCADALALPLRAGSVDLVFSNLMLQWCERPDQVFLEVARVLRPGGLLLFSSFGPGTLEELRTAWSAVDDAVHVSEFPTLQQLGAALLAAGLESPVIDGDEQVLHYPDAYALMRELKQVGAHNAARARPRGLTGRHRMQGMIDAYERMRLEPGLPARYEVLYGAAFGAQARTSGSEHVVPLERLRRRS